MRRTLEAALLLSVACAEPQTSLDSDGDGLTDGEEATLGSDPKLADTDGDGLSDREEVDAQTDFANPDSDGDRYTDFDELAEGHSPLDPDDRIYVGGWPYNRTKHQIEDPGFTGVPEVGGAVPRLVWSDQHGQPVDLYDFGGQGRLAVIELSGTWCVWCHETAKWLAREPSLLDAPYADHDAIREAVEAGELHWLTLIDADDDEGPADQAIIEAWYLQHPNERIPVLLDAEAAFLPWVSRGEPWFYPSFLVVDDQMRAVFVPAAEDGAASVFPALAELLSR